MLSVISIALLAWACAAAPNPMITAAPMLRRAAMPEHCTTVFQNLLLESTWTAEHECYTRTETVIKDSCRCAQAPDIMCLQYIEETTMNLPCSTDCCPSTKTVVEEACPKCNPRECTVSTRTNFRYTGCAAEKPSGMPTVVVTGEAEPTPFDPADVDDKGRMFPPPMGPYVPEAAGA